MSAVLTYVLQTAQYLREIIASFSKSVTLQSAAMVARWQIP
jgi:hypothetical protein